MTRTVFGFCVAAAFSAVATLGAQSSSTTTSDARSQGSDRDMMTVTGCLMKGSDGHFTLTNARVDRSASRTESSSTPSNSTSSSTAPSTSADSSRSNTATGTTGTTAGASAMSTFMLEGSKDRELTDHVGQRVQVTGKMAASTTSTTTTGTTGKTSSSGGSTDRASSMAGAQRLDVSSVTMIAAACQ